MWWIITPVYWLLRNLIIEFIFFILVDVVVKTPLREARNNAEKRTIWLCEAGVLLGICAIIYWTDHTPFLLLLLAAATGIYTQLYGRLDIRQWWVSMCTRWEEYQQHEESMRQVQVHLARQVAVAPTVSQSSLAGPPSPLAGTPGLYPLLNSSQNAGVSRMMPTQGYPPNVTLLPGREVSGGPTVNLTGPVFRGSHGGLIWSSLSEANNGQSTRAYATQQSTVSSSAIHFGGQNHASGTRLGQPTSHVKRSAAGSISGDKSTPKWFGGDLKRKPLRQVDSQALGPTSGLASSGASAIKKRFMNAFGFGDQVKKPPGLKNNGQNQCFMNSVLQCLARSPYLVQCLAADAAKELEGTVSECSLLSELSRLLDLLTVEPEVQDIRIVDPTAFRSAASALNRNLVSPVGYPQSQQDAAEFLMWLLDMVHNILNKNRLLLTCDADSENGVERFSSPRLAILRFIYGDLKPARAKELKDVCKREIEEANGLVNESYAESIQRLSDLEWLLHKQCNESIIDGLFTGQLVEALLTSSHRISVSLQTFNVLPVPLAAPRPVSGLVCLEDCFTAFCHIENLVSSASGIGDFAWDVNCTQKSKTHNSSRPAANSALHSPLSRMPSVVSPIVGQTDFVNDSGFYDHVIKTSTPIRDCSNQFSTASTSVQRRCLLRQLPECLIIQLMRFQYDVEQGRPTKLRAPVSVRLKGLNLHALVYDTVTQREDLAVSTEEAGSHVYDLYGLCLHLGADSTHHGHYISYALTTDERWYCFDDETVSEVNMEYELTTKEVRQNAYILFYKRAAS